MEEKSNNTPTASAKEDTEPTKAPTHNSQHENHKSGDQVENNLNKNLNNENVKHTDQKLPRDTNETHKEEPGEEAEGGELEEEKQINGIDVGPADQKITKEHQITTQACITKISTKDEHKKSDITSQREQTTTSDEVKIDPQVQSATEQLPKDAHAQEKPARHEHNRNTEDEQLDSGGGEAKSSANKDEAKLSRIEKEENDEEGGHKSDALVGNQEAKPDVGQVQVAKNIANVTPAQIVPCADKQTSKDREVKDDGGLNKDDSPVDNSNRREPSTGNEGHRKVQDEGEEQGYTSRESNDVVQENENDAKPAEDKQSVSNSMVKPDVENLTVQPQTNSAVESVRNVEKADEKASNVENDKSCVDEKGESGKDDMNVEGTQTGKVCEQGTQLGTNSVGETREVVTDDKEEDKTKKQDEHGLEIIVSPQKEKTGSGEGVIVNGPPMELEIAKGRDEKKDEGMETLQNQKMPQGGHGDGKSHANDTKAHELEAGKQMIIEDEDMREAGKNSKHHSETAAPERAIAESADVKNSPQRNPIIDSNASNENAEIVPMEGVVAASEENYDKNVVKAQAAVTQGDNVTTKKVEEVNHQLQQEITKNEPTGNDPKNNELPVKAKLSPHIPAASLRVENKLENQDITANQVTPSIKDNTLGTAAEQQEIHKNEKLGEDACGKGNSDQEDVDMDKPEATRQTGSSSGSPEEPGPLHGETDTPPPGNENDINTRGVKRSALEREAVEAEEHGPSSPKRPRRVTQRTLRARSYDNDEDRSKSEPHSTAMERNEKGQIKMEDSQGPRSPFALKIAELRAQLPKPVVTDGVMKLQVGETILVTEDQLDDVRKKRMQDKELKPFEYLTFADVASYNRDQLRCYCFIYGTPRRKKSEMELDMAMFLCLWNHDKPEYALHEYVPKNSKEPIGEAAALSAYEYGLRLCTPSSPSSPDKNDSGQADMPRMTRRSASRASYGRASENGARMSGKSPIPGTGLMSGTNHSYHSARRITGRSQLIPNIQPSSMRPLMQQRQPGYERPIAAARPNMQINAAGIMQNILPHGHGDVSSHVSRGQAGPSRNYRGNMPVRQMPRGYGTSFKQRTHARIAGEKFKAAYNGGGPALVHIVENAAAYFEGKDSPEVIRDQAKSYARYQFNVDMLTEIFDGPQSEEEDVNAVGDSSLSKNDAEREIKAQALREVAKRIRAEGASEEDLAMWGDNVRKIEKENKEMERANMRFFQRLERAETEEEVEAIKRDFERHHNVELTAHPEPLVRRAVDRTLPPVLMPDNKCRILRFKVA